MVLAGGESGYLQIWDLINVQEVCRITAHEGKTGHRLAMNSKGKREKRGARRRELSYFLAPNPPPPSFFVCRFSRCTPIDVPSGHY